MFKKQNKIYNFVILCYIKNYFKNEKNIIIFKKYLKINEKNTYKYTFNNSDKLINKIKVIIKDITKSQKSEEIILANLKILAILIFIQEDAKKEINFDTFNILHTPTTIDHLCFSSIRFADNSQINYGSYILSVKYLDRLFKIETISGINKVFTEIDKFHTDYNLKFSEFYKKLDEKINKLNNKNIKYYENLLDLIIEEVKEKNFDEFTNSYKILNSKVNSKNIFENIQNSIIINKWLIPEFLIKIYTLKNFSTLNPDNDIKLLIKLSALWYNFDITNKLKKFEEFKLNPYFSNELINNFKNKIEKFLDTEIKTIKSNIKQKIDSNTTKIDFIFNAPMYINDNPDIQEVYKKFLLNKDSSNILKKLNELKDLFKKKKKTDNMDKKKIKINELKKLKNSKNENPIVIFAKKLLGGKQLKFNNTAELSIEEKRIFVRTYYIPMLYLLYSYYYTKFYNIQKIKTFNIENKFNYDNITLLFDKQNPAMKKINVYLYENFKKGKIEKLAPIDDNLSSDIAEKKDNVIKFLQNIDTVLEKNIDLINERLKKDSQIIYDLEQYINHLIKLESIIYPVKDSLNPPQKDTSSDILDILKTMKKDEITDIDEIYSNYKEAVRLINNVNIDLILRNEYDKEEDIITIININSIGIVKNIRDNINTKKEENIVNQGKYRIFIDKNDKLIDLLDDEKELIIGFLEKVKNNKIYIESTKYKKKFNKIKTDIYGLIRPTNFNNNQIDSEKNNLEDLLNIMYLSIYINEEIEYEYLDLKLNETHIYQKDTKDYEINKKYYIISYKFYIDNILQRFKKEKKDKTKLINKRIEIFKKDIQDLKKKIIFYKETHNRESNVIAQKSKNIIKIEANKKKNLEEARRRETEISQLRSKLSNPQSFRIDQRILTDLARIEPFKNTGNSPPGPTMWTPTSIQGAQSIDISKQEIIEKTISTLMGMLPSDYKRYREQLNKLEKLPIITSTNKNNKKKNLEKNIEDYKKLKSLIEYKIKQTDDILLNISTKKSEFDQKDTDEINFDDFKESYLSAFTALNEISNKIRNINLKILLNNSNNRFYTMLISDTYNVVKNLTEPKNPPKSQNNKKLYVENFIKDVEQIIYIKFNKKIIENKEIAQKLKYIDDGLFITKLNKEIEVLKDMPPDIQNFFKKINLLDTEIWEMIRNIIKEYKENKLIKPSNDSLKNIYKNKYDKYNLSMISIKNYKNTKQSEYTKLIPYTDCIYMYFLRLFSIIEILTKF